MYSAFLFSLLLGTSGAFFIAPFIIASRASAESSFEEQQKKYIEASSKFMIVRIVPGDKTAKLFILGKKTAELNLNKDAKLVSVTVLGEGKKEELKFSPLGDAYEISPFPHEKNLELEIKAELRGKSDKVKIKVKQP